MLIDIEGLRAVGLDLDVAGGRLAVVRADAVACLGAIGQEMNAAAVAVALESAAAVLASVAASAKDRAQLAVDAEQTFAATLPSARTDAMQAAMALRIWGEAAERARRLDVDEAAVDRALEEIVQALSTGGRRLLFFSVGDTDVSAQDLSAILDVLESLNSSELQLLYWRLDEDERADLVSQNYDGQGLARSDRLRYIELLAGGLNASQLLDQLDILGSDAIELASAIGSNAPPAVAGTVMRSIGAGATGQMEAMDVFAALGANLDVEVLDDVLAVGYGTGWLFDLLDSSFVSELNPTSGFFERVASGGSQALVTRYDSERTIAILDVVNRGSNVDVRADVWVAAVGLLEEPLANAAAGIRMAALTPIDYYFKDDSESATMDALQAILSNQPLETFDRLRLRADQFGSATSDFFREVLRDGRDGISREGAVSVNEIFGELLGGDSDGAADFFTRRDPVVGGGEDYRNAMRLGFVSATVSRGLDALEPSGQDAEEVLGLVLGFADLGPLKVGPFADLAFYINDQIASQDLAALRNEADFFQRILMTSIVPRDLAGNRYEVDSVEEFEGAYTFILGFAPRNGD